VVCPLSQAKWAKGRGTFSAITNLETSRDLGTQRGWPSISAPRIWVLTLQSAELHIVENLKHTSRFVFFRMDRNIFLFKIEWTFTLPIPTFSQYVLYYYDCITIWVVGPCINHHSIALSPCDL
jgi:hypothetical protein